MKIKKEFWDLIKNESKNVELRKVNKLQELFNPELIWENENIFDEKGRFTISLYNYTPEIDNYDCLNESRSYHECEPNIIGYITFSGYEIIKKEQYDNWFYLVNDFLLENEYSHQVDLDISSINLFQDLITEDETIPFWFIENFEWIYDNWKWLADNFENENEILVLKIENWKK